MRRREAGPASRLDIVFLGTSAFAETVLGALHREHRVRAVVTQPDRRAGRGRRLRRSRVGKLAGELRLPLFQPRRIRLRRSWAPLGSLAPDCLVVADYGQILPRGLLAVPRLGPVNVHASLLPEFRGAAPAIWAIARGARRTGVTTMLMDAGLDTGPVLHQAAVEVLAEETGGSLLARLAPIGAELLLRTLHGLARGTTRPRPQDDAKATWAPRVSRADAALDWETEASGLVNRVRAFSPVPTAFTVAAPEAGFAPGPLRIHAARAVRQAGAAADPPGSFRVLGPRSRPRLSVACGGGTLLHPLEVQAAGRKRMGIADFLRGSLLSRSRPSPAPAASGLGSPPAGEFLGAAAAAAAIRLPARAAPSKAAARPNGRWRRGPGSGMHR